MSVVLIYPFDGDPACATATIFQEVVDQRLHSGEVRPVKDGSAFSPGCDEPRVGQFLQMKRKSWWWYFEFLHQHADWQTALVAFQFMGFYKFPKDLKACLLGEGR